MSEYDALPQSLRSEVPACVDPSDYTIFDRKILAAADAIDALVRERDALREALRANHYELEGVIADIECGTEFDDVCLQTVKRVSKWLARAALTASAPTGPRNPSAE